MSARWFSRVLLLVLFKRGSGEFIVTTLVEHQEELTKSTGRSRTLITIWTRVMNSTSFVPVDVETG